MLVQKLMTPNPITVDPADSLGDALGTMLRHDIHELPVMEGDRLIGIVTRRDLQVALGPGSLSLDPDALSSEAMESAVREVMTTDVETIAPTESLATACRMLVSLRVGALPVVDAMGKLRGILSVTDVVAAAADLFERR